MEESWVSTVSCQQTNKSRASSQRASDVSHPSYKTTHFHGIFHLQQMSIGTKDGDRTIVRHAEWMNAGLANNRKEGQAAAPNYEIVCARSNSYNQSSWRRTRRARSLGFDSLRMKRGMVQSRLARHLDRRWNTSDYVSFPKGGTSTPSPPSSPRRPVVGIVSYLSN